MNMIGRIIPRSISLDAKRKLLLWWAAGLIIGTLFAAGSDPCYFALMRPLFFRVSIVILIISAALPFLISAYAVMIRRQEILYFVCFGNACSMAACAYWIYVSCGTAGWLLQPMAQFSQMITGAILYWFSLRQLSAASKDVLMDHLISISVSVIAALIHYFVVSPFGAELIDHSLGRYAYSCWI